MPRVPIARPDNDFLILPIILQCIWPLGGTHKQEEISGKRNAIQLSEINLEKAKRKQQRQNSDNLDTSLTSEDEASPSKVSRRACLSETDGDDQIFATPNGLDNFCQKKVQQNLERESPEQDHIIENSRKKARKHKISDIPISNPNSPASSLLSNSTPVRNNDDFAIPSSVIGTPFRSMTPLHVPKMLSPLPMTPYRSRDSERSFSEDTSLPSMSPLPKYLSPLPSTPYRSLGSERFIADNDLVDMTDSEISDMDQTPSRRNVNIAMDMPNFNSPSKLKPKPTYSKDLSKLSTTPSSPENSPSSRNVKMLLKRNQANKKWNVEESPPTERDDQDVVLPDRPVTTGKQPMKLDKVVLNLKKSAGNTWNIADKKSSNDNNAEQDNQQPSLVQPKEERRGRKSKSVPMKIQNADEIQIGNDTALIRSTSTTATVSGAIQEESAVRATETESSGPLVAEDLVKISSQTKIASSVINKQPSTPTSSQRILTEKSEKQRKKMASSSSRRCEPIQELGIQKQPATTTTTAPVESQRSVKLSTGVAVRKTFQRKRLPTIQRNCNLLGSTFHNTSSSRTTKQFQECQLPDDWKQIAELSSKAAVAFNNDQEFSEVSELMKVATGAETNIDLGFIQKVQQKLSLKNVSKVTFFVGQDKANIDLPTDDTSMVLSDPYACTEIRLDERSDGIDGNFLKVKEPEPMLHVEPKKRGRPKSQKVVPERPPASVLPISPPPSMVPMHQPNEYLPRQQPLPILANACGFPAFNTIEDFLSNPIAILNFVS